jgi:hypothetical protein
VDKMEYHYDLNTNNIYIKESKISAYSLEKNEIGNCSSCDAILISLSYHSIRESIVVVTKCAACGAFYANIYDSEWNWVDEAYVTLIPIPIPIFSQIIDDFEGLERISMKKLESVFSKGEIEAIIAKSKNENPIRQYLYRARKKYLLFEEIFDIKLDF